MNDLDRLIEWHKNELRHIRSALETDKPARAKNRWEIRRRNHERTVQALTRLRSWDGLCELQQESEAIGQYEVHQWVGPTGPVKWEHCSVCGVIRRLDGLNSTECKGRPLISTRTSTKSTPRAE